MGYIQWQILSKEKWKKGQVGYCLKLFKDDEEHLKKLENYFDSTQTWGKT